MSTGEPSGVLLRNLVLAAFAGGVLMAFVLIAGLSRFPPERETAAAPVVIVTATPPPRLSTTATAPLAATTSISFPSMSPTPAFLASTPTSRPATTVSPPAAGTTSPATAISGTPGPPAIELVGSPPVVAAGSQAQVIIRTAPGAGCQITVQFPNGPSQAAGLTPKTADVLGQVVWNWTVAAITSPGRYEILLVCTNSRGTGRLTIPFEVL